MALGPYSANLQRWANKLNADTAWVNALNSAFDAVGFTDTYIAEASERRLRNRRKAVKDNVWGMVEIEPVAAWLIDSPLMQRLRYVKQLGLSYLTYPGAQHSRFEHSIGVHHVVNRLLSAFERNARNERAHRGPDDVLQATAYETESYAANAARLAAILHDIGHTPFSHACEQFFELHPETTKVGPYSVKAFMDTFRLWYSGIAGGQRVTAQREKKSLSEVFSAAVVLSPRFRSFLERSSPWDPQPRTAEEACCDMAALILGDPLEESDRALPQLISGPFDADKIDYMLRDSHACGLELGIDVSRLFFRASVYEVLRPEALTVHVPKHIRDAALPVKLFLLDQSGTDSALEMGLARLALYSRVYYHQLTLNAQAQLLALMEAACSSSVDAAEWSDFLSVWTHSDQSVLYRLSNDSEPLVRRFAVDILGRRLLKRAACFSIDMIRTSALGAPLPSPGLNDRIEDFHLQTHKLLSDLLKSPVEAKSVVDEIKAICKEFVHELQRQGEPAANLPRTSEPEFVRFIMPGDGDRPLLPQALVITPSREVSQQRARDSSYVDAGRLAVQKGYLLVPEEWRELALLAFQVVLFRRPELVIERASSVDAHGVLFRPVLKLDASANESRVNWHNARAWQVKLSLLYSGAQMLVDLPASLTSSLGSDAAALAAFEGEKGWRLTTGNELDSNKVAAFLRQFPPDLRPAARDMVVNLRVLTRAVTVQLLQTALGQYRTKENPTEVALVPLTPSSGERMREVLKDELGAFLGFAVVSQLQDALKEGNSFKEIVFIDDNIVSGSQCLEQMRYWLDLDAKERPSDANYWQTPLSPKETQELAGKTISFAFALGSDQNKAGIAAALDSVLTGATLKRASELLYFGAKLSDHSGALGAGYSIPDDLREFLRLVGGQVIRPHIARDNPEMDETSLDAECERRALGYGNAEAFLATSLNVPSSTYTALWCPGIYEYEGGAGKTVRLPWLPLLVRNGHERNTIVF